MPGSIIHIEVARQVAHKINRADLLDESSPLIDYYMQGALAPDLGAFPGCDPFLSDLTHYVRAGELCRFLLTTAKSEKQSAFALGWLTHFYADVYIHPLINQEVSKKFYHGTKSSVLWEDDSVSHVRIETALDGDFFYTTGTKAYKFSRSVLSDPAIEQLMASAWHAIYQINLPAANFIASHKQSLKLSKILRDFSLMHGAHHFNKKFDPAVANHSKLYFYTAKTLEFLLGRRSPYYHITAIDKTSDSLLNQIASIITPLVSKIVEVAQTKEIEIPNFNLDSGLIDGKNLTPYVGEIYSKLKSIT